MATFEVPVDIIRRASEISLSSRKSRSSITNRLLSRARPTKNDGIVKPPSQDSTYPPGHLFSLPGEIRNYIYTFVFQPEDERDWLQRHQIDPHFHNGLSFLQTCRLVYHEARDLAWAGYTPVLSQFENPYEFSLPYKVSKAVTIGLSKKGTRVPLHLIQRVTVQQYLFFTIYSWWMLKNHQLQPKEVIFEYCLCTKLSELEETPDKLTHVLNCMDSAARCVVSLRRIVIYSCSKVRDSYARAFQSYFRGVQSQDGWCLKPISSDFFGSTSASQDDSPAPIETAASLEKRLEQLWNATTTFELYTTRPTEIDHKVLVEFIDTSVVSSRTCVKDHSST